MQDLLVTPAYRVWHTQVFEKEKRKTERTKQGGSVDQLTSLKSNLTSLE